MCGPVPRVTIDQGVCIIILNLFVFPGLGTQVSACIDMDGKFRLELLLLGFAQQLLAPILVGWIWSGVWAVRICALAAAEADTKKVAEEVASIEASLSNEEPDASLATETSLEYHTRVLAEISEQIPVLKSTYQLMRMRADASNPELLAQVEAANIQYRQQKLLKSLENQPSGTDIELGSL